MLKGEKRSSRRIDEELKSRSDTTAVSRPDGDTDKEDGSILSIARAK
jgi:hypothetical protein